MSQHYNQSKSQCRKWGMSKHEDYLEQCLLQMGLPVKRKQIFCFKCANMWTNESNEYPGECHSCGAWYTKPGLFCMPDLVVEDPGRHGKAVIFVQSHKYHDGQKAKIKDTYQMEILKKNNWKVFEIYNDELDKLHHANRCFLLLGMFRASLDVVMYRRAYEYEKELIH